MEELKVIRHIQYSYETSDGKEFGSKKEAKEWQKQLNLFQNLCMLDSDYIPTKDINSAVYVYAKTKEEAESFNEIAREKFGYCSEIGGTGWFRYDEISDSYVDIEVKIEKLQHIIDMLKKGGEG
jgi:hypothetical protein